MTLYLSHESALRYWLTKREGECVPDGVSDRNLAFARASMGEIKGSGLPFDFSRDRPLHLLVPSRGDIRRLKSAVTHVWGGDVPAGAFNELLGPNRVSSPEFTFLQMAIRRPLHEVVELGCYLCGSFSVADDGRGYAGRRDPLTTPESIGAFLDAAKGSYGIALARRALGYVVPCAASPKEVMLVMTFTFPIRLGGWEFPDIVANQRIEVAEYLRILAEASYFKGDIFMPAIMGDVEYDSYEFHTGRYRLDHTQTRRNVLEAMGVKTVSATYGQIETFDKFEAFISMTKERFGLEQREFDEGERFAQKNLYAYLMDNNKVLF